MAYKVVNDAAEAQSYRLWLRNNNNNAVVVAGGNPGPEFTSVSGVPLNAHDSTKYRVDVRQLTPDNLSFSNLEFQLYNLCDTGISSSVYSTVNYVNMVKSITNGAWNNVFTWDAKRIPQPTDNVIIDNNNVITIAPNLDLKCKNLTLGTGAQITLPSPIKLTL